MRSVVLAVVLASAALPVRAQPAPVCAEAAQVIDDQLKEYAYADISGLADDSSPRATMRASQQTAQMATIQANLALMTAAHCPPPVHALSAHTYAGAAADCVTATMDQIKSKCDRSAWTPKP